MALALLYKVISHMHFKYHLDTLQHRGCDRDSYLVNTIAKDLSRTMDYWMISTTQIKYTHSQLMFSVSSCQPMLNLWECIPLRISQGKKK